MNRYWLSQDGRTTGPFAEEIILDMWRRGQITLDAQVCLEETEDWLDARFLVNELTTPQRSLAHAARSYEPPAPVKKTGGGKAVGLFVAVILMAVVAWMVRGPREVPMTEDSLLFFFAALAIMIILAICLLMVRGGMILGLMTLVFAILLAGGTISRWRFEAQKKELERFQQDMRRLAP